MIFLYGGCKFVEAETFSGVVTELKKLDYTKPVLNISFKKKVLSRINESGWDRMFISDEDFINLLQEKNLLALYFRVVLTESLFEEVVRVADNHNEKVFEDAPITIKEVIMRVTLLSKDVFKEMSRRYEMAVSYTSTEVEQFIPVEILYTLVVNDN